MAVNNTHRIFSYIRKIVLVLLITQVIIKGAYSIQCINSPCYREGFEAERIEAVLHSIELGQKHQTDKFGLHLGIVR